MRRYNSPINFRVVIPRCKTCQVAQNRMIVIVVVLFYLLLLLLFFFFFFFFHERNKSVRGL